MDHRRETERMVEKEMNSRWLLERCRHCKGVAVLGSGGGCRIFCEGCGGTGLNWAEQGPLVPWEDED